jgi:membrane-bound serine protease (ClpP class)
VIIVAVLLGLGLLLLAAEIIVPGGVLGVAGGLMLVAGVVVAFVSHGETAGIAALGVALVAGIAMLVVEFFFLPKSRLAKALSMSTTVAGRSHEFAQNPEALVGQTAVAETQLVPSGYVTVAGKRFEAFSRDGVVEAGAQLRVVGVDNFRLTVTQNLS